MKDQDERMYAYTSWLSKYGGAAKDMTLRDYFAAKVLVSACENNGPKEAAELSYLYADAMLQAREQ